MKKLMLFFGLPVLLCAFFMMTATTAQAVSLYSLYSPEEELEIAQTRKPPTYTDGDGLVYDQFMTIYADGEYYCVLTPYVMGVIHNDNGTDTLRCITDEKLFTGWNYNIRLYKIGETEWYFYDDRPWWIIPNNYTIHRSSYDIFAGQEIDSRFVSEDQPFFVQTRVLPPIARVQDWEAILAPMKTMIVIILAYLVSFVTFWKAWAFLKRTLQGA